MRFLRFKKLISFGQAKYLRYALGEVFFVVIGILLALQVNNLNEERKTRVQEKNVLLALHNEISNNLLLRLVYLLPFLNGPYNIKNCPFFNNFPDSLNNDFVQFQEAI